MLCSGCRKHHRNSPAIKILLLLQAIRIVYNINFFEHFYFRLNHNNRGTYMLIKTSGLLPEDNATTNAAAGTLAGGAGAIILGNVKREGLTGRTKLYHGTPEANKSSILEKGVLPTTRDRALNTQILRSFGEDFFEKQLGKSYFDKKRDIAQLYADKHGHGTIIEADVPLWKHKVVPNPEVGSETYDQWRKRIMDNRVNTLKRMGFTEDMAVDLVLRANGGEAGLQNQYNMYKGHTVLEGGVSPEYVKGSKHYKRLGLKELREYVHANPSKFGKEIGKLGLGGGLVGGSAYLLHKALKQRKAEQA